MWEPGAEGKSLDRFPNHTLALKEKHIQDLQLEMYIPGYYYLEGISQKRTHLSTYLAITILQRHNQLGSLGKEDLVNLRVKYASKSGAKLPKGSLSLSQRCCQALSQSSTNIAQG